MKTTVLLALYILPLMALAQVDTGGTFQNGFDEFSSFDSIDSTESVNEVNYGMDGVFGFVNIDNETYSQVRLMPEITFGKIGFGLDMDILIDNNGRIRKDDWDEWQDYLYKVLYLRYGDREDPVYFKIGNIRDYTMARGMIFSRYSNMLLYPSVRNLGGFVGFNSSILGLGGEVYTHNIYKNEILSGRVHAKPLSVLDTPLIMDLKIGINIGYDRNVYAKYKDSDGDGIPDVYDEFPNDRRIWLDTDGDGFPDYPFPGDLAYPDIIYDLDIAGLGFIDHPNDNPYVGIVFPDILDLFPPSDDRPYNTGFSRDYATPITKSKDILIYGIDYRIPLIDNKELYLYNYGEFAQINGYGHGLIFPGFGADFSIFNVLMEFRNFGDRFKPGFFDHVYDDERCQVDYEHDSTHNRNVYSLRGKESILDEYKSSWGWYGSVLANIQEMLYFKVAYQDMYGENVRTGKSLWAGLKVIQDYIPRLAEASISYSQRNVHFIDFGRLRNTAAQIDGRLTYSITSDARLIGKLMQRYVDINNDGYIRGKDEVINTITFGVEFRF